MMKTHNLLKANGTVRMVVLANDDGSPRLFGTRAAALLEAAKHPNAKPAANNFAYGDNDRFYVRIYSAT